MTPLPPEVGAAPAIRTFDATTTGNRAPQLVGRRSERARLRRLLTAAAAGPGAVLVIRGAPGMGKTALLGYAADVATGWRVVRVRGLADEADLPYSGLHLLCSALGTEFARLEPHQREGLETVIGLRAGTAPDRLAVCVAIVELLTLAAETRPLVCLVDDVQWLDTASAYVLAFVARRMGQAPIALLFADRGEDFADLPDLPLDGLGYADSRKLIESALPTPLDDAVVARLISESRGNPRALLETAWEASPGDFGGGYGVAARTGTEGVPLSGLAPGSRLLLTLAAAEPLGDPVRLCRAARRLGIEPEAAEQLESEGLVSFGIWVTFRDPWLRGFVYDQASATDRRRVHGALAAVTDPVAEPDRHAWHLAYAFAEPDDAVSNQLVRVAEKARDRGGVAAEAAFLARAAVRTATPTLRAELAISAAEAYHTAGAGDAAVRSLAIAERGSVNASIQVRLVRLRTRMAFDAIRSRAAVAELVEAAQGLEAAAPHLSEAAHLEAVGAAIFTGHLDMVRTVLAQIADRPPGSTGRLLRGVAQRFTSGYAAAVEPLKHALKTLDCDHEEDTRSRLLACFIASDLWDEDTWYELTDAELARARRAGARTILPYALTHRALVEIQTGCFAAAQSLVDETAAVTRAAGSPSFPHAVALLAAWRGVEHPIMAFSEGAHRGHEGAVVAIAPHATAVLRNGLGSYEEAVAATRGQLECERTELLGWSLVELIEGAVRCGERDTAAAALDQLSERAYLSGTEWALGVEARSRALLRDDAAAEDLYVEAIDRLGRTRIKTDLARAQLVYGEWLSRRGRWADARGPLRTAHESFQRMGARAFAGRAARELLATGGRRRLREPEVGSRLTAKEGRIASLARDGRSNSEIAAVLAISPRTVEYHLHKVFTKLSITSRAELYRALSEGQSR